jgi:hypothetical protein
MKIMMDAGVIMNQDASLSTLKAGLSRIKKCWGPTIQRPHKVKCLFLLLREHINLVLRPIPLKLKVFFNFPYFSGSFSTPSSMGLILKS